MRTRQEIEKELEPVEVGGHSYAPVNQAGRIEIDLLLDIRDILLESSNKKDK